MYRSVHKKSDIISETRQSSIITGLEMGKGIDRRKKGQSGESRTFRREMPRYILGHQLIDLLHCVLALEAGLRQAGLFIPNSQCERVWGVATSERVKTSEGGPCRAG